MPPVQTQRRDRPYPTHASAAQVRLAKASSRRWRDAKSVWLATIAFDRKRVQPLLLLYRADPTSMRSNSRNSLDSVTYMPCTAFHSAGTCRVLGSPRQRYCQPKQAPATKDARNSKRYSRHEPDTLHRTRLKAGGLRNQLQPGAMPILAHGYQRRAVLRHRASAASDQL